MKLADVLSALRRRWYIVVASVLVALGAGYLVWSSVEPDYERSATQLLLPGAATVPDGANPYLYVGGLAQATDILVRAAGAEDVVAEAAAQYPDTAIEVTRDSAAGAVVVTTVTASSDEAAAAVLDSMLDLNVVVLDGLQDSQRIPTDERISITPLTADTRSDVIQKTRMAMTAIAAFGVVILGLLIAGVVDGVLKPRRRLRPIHVDQNQDQEESSGEAATSGVPDVQSVRDPVADSAGATARDVALEDPAAAGDPDEAGDEKGKEPPHESPAESSRVEPLGEQDPTAGNQAVEVAPRSARAPSASRHTPRTQPRRRSSAIMTERPAAPSPPGTDSLAEDESALEQSIIP